ncbi:MAG: RCC1 domain-containing protein [Gemmatimonadales bacterium]
MPQSTSSKGSTLARASRLAGTLLTAGLAAGCGADRIAAPKLPDAPLAASSVATGFGFTCALTAAGKPYCWGANGDGEIGDSTFVPHLVPSAALTTQTFVAIYAGNTTACALDHSGTAWCWGDDPSQPGVAVSLLYTPRVVQAPAAFGSLTVGRKFACGLDGAGNAYCWGENRSGQLGVGDKAAHASPTRVKGGLRFTSLAAGFFTACGVTSDGAAHCWGDNTYGELGTGDTLSASQPRLVAGGHRFASLSGGSTHQCGVARDGTAFCWGSNASGQLGDGTGTTRVLPTAVVGGLHFSTIRSHRTNSIFAATCGIATEGGVYCWGWNGQGQLGVDPSTTTDACTTLQPAGTTNVPGVVTNQCSYHPIQVPGLSNVTAIDGGLGHNCALTTAAQLFCWGSNTSGELGDGTGVNHTTPVSPAGGLSFP